MSFRILAEASKSRVSSGPESTTTQWFKSKPLKVLGPFALQLETKSPEAVNGGNPSIWFEIVTHTDIQGKSPSKAPTYSHMNECISKSQDGVWHFGPIFYPDHDLIQSLKGGDVIGVQIASRSKDWSLQIEGRLVVKPLANLLPLTECLTWSLRDSPEEGVYTILIQNKCVAASNNSSPVKKVWFQTPPLPEDITSRLDSFKLYTSASHQGWISNISQGIWSWFELGVFKNENEKEIPLNFNSPTIVAESHKIAAQATHSHRQEGKLFRRGESFVSQLEAGNTIGVLVCAQFPGWKNNADYGRLLISLSARKTQPLSPKEGKLRDFTLDLLKMVMQYDKDILKGVLRELEVGVLSRVSEHLYIGNTENDRLKSRIETKDQTLWGS